MASSKKENLESKGSQGEDKDAKIQELQNLVKRLQIQNTQTSSQLQEERLRFESNSIDYESQINMLKGQASKFEATSDELVKTKDELEAAQMELDHLSKLYAEFMAWKRDKLALEGERDKLLQQNKRQRDTIEVLEKNLTADSKAKIKSELEQEERRRFKKSPKTGKKNADNKQTALLNRVIEEKVKLQNSSWLSLGGFLSDDPDVSEHDVDGDDLNALKRLDDRMVRAEQISSKSLEELPPQSHQHDDEEDQDYDDSYQDQRYNNMASSSSLNSSSMGSPSSLKIGLAGFLNGMMGSGGRDSNDNGNGDGDGAYTTSLRDQQEQHYDYCSERDSNAPRVSEDPRNLHNIINLI